MNDSSKGKMNTWTTDPGMVKRYAPIHGMVTELLATTDPDGCADLVEGLRARYKPEGVEVHVVTLMAELDWRIRGCQYLETEILNGSIEARATSPETPHMARGRAYNRDFKDPNLLDKLSRYESRLSREFKRCVRIMELAAKNRKLREARMADTLARYKPCTSVIQ